MTRRDPPCHIFWLLLALLPATTRGDGGVARPCEVQLAAEPPELRLGSGASAVVRVKGVADEPRVEVSAGRVGAFRRASPDEFVAEYVPPPEKYPRVAIVSLADSARCGWTVVRLHGIGDAVARARPGTEVAVRVGDATFGPQRTDSTGHARIPVVVPPGIRFAYHGDEPIPLSVPPIRRVVVTVDRAEAGADREQLLLVHAVAVEEDGSPAAAPTLEVSRGTLGRPERRGDGVYGAHWRIPPGPVGTAFVRARIQGEPLGAEAAVRLVAGAAHRVEIDADHAAIVAGNSRVVGFRVLDAAGNPGTGAPRLTASIGAFGPVETVGPGLYSARFAAPELLGYATEARLMLQAGEATAAIALPLAPAGPDELRVEVAARSVVADGERGIEVRVAAVDRFGNAAAVDAPRVEASRGDVMAATRDRRGGWTLRYRPWPHEERERDTIRASAGRLVGAADVVLAPPRLVSLAPRLGLVATASGVAPYAGLSAVLWRRRSALELGVEAGWFALSRDQSIAVGVASLPFRARADFLGLLATAGWRHPVSERTTLWVNAGAGAARVVATSSAGSQPSRTEAGFSPVVQLGLGVGFRALGGHPFVELRVAEHLDPGLATFQGSFTSITSCVGYRRDVH